MSLFQTLTEKSWESGQPPLQPDTELRTSPPQKIALFFFLGVATVLFGLFVTAYFVRMELEDWRPMPESGLLWVNTFVLFLSSIVLQGTSGILKQGQRERVGLGLALGGLLSLAFVLGQLAVWRQMTDAGYYLASNPANAFFYVLTGVHALHLLGGLYVWLRAGLKLLSGAELRALRLSVELCTLYWHFLLLVWLALFALVSYT